MRSIKNLYIGLPKPVQKALKGLSIAVLGAVATYLETLKFPVSDPNLLLLITTINSAVVNAVKLFGVWLFSANQE